MRWVCPGCGSQVSVALSQCPTCGSTEEGEPPTSEPVSVPPPQARPAPPRPSSERAGRPLPAPRPAAAAEPKPESPFWRGVRFGIGFMLAVAMILLLLAMVMTWLRQHGWQPWLDFAPP